MKWTTLITVTAAAMLLAAAFAPSAAQAADAKRVTVYMYSEYIDPEMLTEFQKLTGMEAKVDVYENSEEMMAKLQQGGGTSQYDVVVVSDVNVPAMVKLGLIRPLDKAKLPNAANVSEQFANPPFDPGCQYTLPYQWGTVGLMFNKEKVKDAEISWAMIFDPAKEPGRFILMDSMRDMIGIALKYNGFSMNSRKPEELKKAADTILAAKKSSNSLGFEGGVGGKNRVAAGEAAAAIVYNGDAIRACAEDAKLGFAVPKEGGIIWVDVMAITSKAPNPEGALAFINYILDPKAGAQLSNFNRYATPNKASMPMIEEKDRNDPGIYPSDEIVKKLEYLEDVGDDTRLYDEIWTMVKAR